MTTQHTMTEPEHKKAVALVILESGPLTVCLSTRHPEVDLPTYLKEQTHTKLILDHAFARPPIPDLVVDDNGIRATLSFRGSPYYCTIPWDAVFLLCDAENNGMGWSIPDSGTEDLEPPSPEAAASPEAVTDLAAYRKRRAQ